MHAFSRNQITEANELNECRISNKVYPPSAAPEATREFRMMKLDELVKSPQVVTPAKAGVQNLLNLLDSRFHGNDRKGRSPTFYEAVKFDEFVKSPWNYSGSTI
jgi:hypothetical protein